MKCGLQTPVKGGIPKPCYDDAVKTVAVVIHSNIFSVCKELDNKTKYYRCCAKHWELIKDNPNVSESK